MQWVYRSRAEAEAWRIAEEWGSPNWLSSKELTNGEEITLGRVIIRK